MSDVLHSATDLERLACERYYAFWHWGPELGFDREPKTQQLGLGIELHELAEIYLRNGEMPAKMSEAALLFEAAKPYLPEPGAGGVEGDGRLTISGESYFTQIDYLGPLPGLAGAWILDHKTSSNPSKWGLDGKFDRMVQGPPNSKGRRPKPAQVKGFLDNVQAIIYATWHLVKTGEPEAKLRWLYYNTKSTRPQAEPHDILLTRGELEEAFGRVVHPKAQKVLALRAEKRHPLELLPNEGQCMAYNRACHYTEVCNLKDVPLHKRLEAQGIIEMASLADRARAKAAEMNGEAPKAAPVETVAEVEEPKQLEIEAAKPSLAAKSKAKAAAKPDLINPPESALAKVATPAAKSVASVFARHLGVAFTSIAKELEG